MCDINIVDPSSLTKKKGINTIKRRADIMSLKLDSAIEHTTYFITVEITDSSGTTVTPTSLKYTLTDSAGNIINNREEISVSGLMIRLEGLDLPVGKKHLSVSGTYDSQTLGDDIIFFKDYIFDVLPRAPQSTLLFTADEIIEWIRSTPSINSTNLTDAQLLDLVKESEDLLSLLIRSPLTPTRCCPRTTDTTGETLPVVREAGYDFNDSPTSNYMFKLRHTPIIEIKSLSLLLGPVSTPWHVPQDWIRFAETGTVQIYPTGPNQMLGSVITNSVFRPPFAYQVDYIAGLNDTQQQTARSLVKKLIIYHAFVNSPEAFNSSVSMSIDGVSESSSSADPTKMYNLLLTQINTFARQLSSVSFVAA